MKRLLRVVAWYAAIALVSTAANIAVQALVVHAWHGPHAIALSVLAGTAAGLPVKYELEKRLVFRFRTRDLRDNGRLFVVYTLFGIFTTGVFWAIEYAFHALFGTAAMRYTGAAIGLALGYVLRYQLDSRYVFRASAGAAAAA